MGRPNNTTKGIQVYIINKVRKDSSTVVVKGTVMSMMRGLLRTQVTRKPSQRKSEGKGRGKKKLGKSRYHTRGIVYPKRIATWRKVNRKSQVGKSSRGTREMSWNGSTVEAVAFNPRPNCNSVLLDWPKRPNWDCGCGMERTLR